MWVQIPSLAQNCESSRIGIGSSHKRLEFTSLAQLARALDF